MEEHQEQHQDLQMLVQPMEYTYFKKQYLEVPPQRHLGWELLDLETLSLQQVQQLVLA